MNTPIEHKTSNYKKHDRRTPRKGSQQERDWWFTRKLMAVSSVRRYGVHWVAHKVHRSLRTVYRWVNAFLTHGTEGLREKSRRPHRIHRLDGETRRRIIDLRNRTGLGCEKIALELMVSPSSVHKVLSEEGLVFRTGRRTRFRHFERKHANSLWQADYTAIREDLWLLLIVDDHSRFIIGHRLMRTPNSEDSLPLFESCFAKYGAPDQILTDHGSPFCPARGGTTDFMRMCVDRSIDHILASVRHPQTTGKVERRHGLVKDHLEMRGVGPSSSPEEVQRAVDEFVEYHNYSRMHFGYERYGLGDLTVRKKVVFLPFLRFVCHR